MNEETQERKAELETQHLNNLARISASDRAALDYVKASAGFKRAYPDIAAEHAAAVQEEESVETSLSEWEFHIGEWRSAGDTVLRLGVTYTVLQGHVLQEDWNPESTPALFRREGDPGDEWPEFVQPTGAHDAYAKGAKVTYKGVHYISLIDANVYSPEAYPAGWEAQE